MWVIEPCVFQMPQLHKHLNVSGTETLLMTKRFISVFTSITILAFFIFHLLTYGKLEFRSEKSYLFFYHGSFALFAILILVLTISLPNDYAGQIGRTLGIFGILVTGAFWLLFYIQLIGEKAVKEDKQILFVNKGNSNERIIEQAYYTGIARSNMNLDTVLTWNIIGNVRWTKTISAEAIDTSVWTKSQAEYR